MTARGLAAVVGLLVTACGCASNPTVPAGAGPANAAFEEPGVPASLNVPPEVRERHVQAWRRLQSGDPRGAGSEFTAIFTR